MEYTPFTNWILGNGISEQTLQLLIAICILATIVSIGRYIFGNKTYGVYAPIILAIAYSYTGLRYGLVITAIVIATTLLIHTVLKKIRMHYITRIAINYCILTIAIIIAFVTINYFGLGLENISNIPPLATISIIALGDFFTKQYIKKGFKTSAMILLSTILISAIGWYVITRELISQYLINNLWIIPILVVVNLLIGQFKGLRIKDYIRFNSIMRENAKQ
jgi:hypothetical protein